MKRQLLIFGVAALLAIPAFGKPARKTPMRVVQPDGSVLTIVKRGDERCHNTFTLDGFLLTKDSAGFYRYAFAERPGELQSGPLAKDEALRDESDNAFLASIDRNLIDDILEVNAGRAESLKKSHNLGNLPRFKDAVTRGPGLFSYDFPVKGEQKGLVILVQFTDLKFNDKNKSGYNSIDPKTYFSEMLNKEGFSTYKATGSARDWFVENSKGQFMPEFDVYGPVTLSKSKAYYGGNDRYGDDKYPHEMVIEACKALDSEINFKDFDRNHDGYVDNVYVIYAGYGEADSDDEDAVWPHSWEISWANSPDGKVAGDPLLLDGVYIDSYGVSNETMGYDSSWNLANRPDGIGTFVHEFSHVMGLPDLYATQDYTSYKNVPFTPDEFSVMDAGSYNNDGLTPPNYSAYERYALDWLQPTTVSTGNHTLVNLADSNTALYLPTEKEQEFYLFENRQLVGNDKYIPYHGMLVWHVDFDREVFYNNEVNNTKSHQYVDLIEADNIQDYPTGKDRWGDFIWPTSTVSGDPFPGKSNVTAFGFNTTPSLRSWAGKTLNTEITSIKEVGQLVALHCETTVSRVDEIETADSIPEGELYDLNGIYVGRFSGENMPELAKGIYILRASDGRSRKIRI